MLTPLQYNLQGGLGHTATAAGLKWRCFERISTLVAEASEGGGSVAELSCQVGLLMFNLSPNQRLRLLLSLLAGLLLLPLVCLSSVAATCVSDRCFASGAETRSVLAGVLSKCGDSRTPVPASHLVLGYWGHTEWIGLAYCLDTQEEWP